jgi:N-methylhydantoinase A/oxoprolinase/acetone carboxylase beta subunit
LDRFRTPTGSLPIEPRSCSVRASAVGRLASPKPRLLELSSTHATPKGSRRVFLRGAWTDCPVWDREALSPKQTITGPAVIEEAYTTVLIEAHWTCRRDATGHLIAERAA